MCLYVCSTYTYMCFIHVFNYTCVYTSVLHISTCALHMCLTVHMFNNRSLLQNIVSFIGLICKWDLHMSRVWRISSTHINAYTCVWLYMCLYVCSIYIYMCFVHAFNYTRVHQSVLHISTCVSYMYLAIHVFISLFLDIHRFNFMYHYL